MNEKPAVQLSGEDSNVFSIIARVSKALKRAGQEDRATEFRQKAFDCGSYGEVLTLCDDYVEVDGEEEDT